MTPHNSPFTCINIRKNNLFLHNYAMSDTSVCTKNSRYASFFRPEKAAKSRFLDAKKMPLQHPLDAIIMLTFFDAVVIAIATCSYRDDNMMLST